MQAIEQLEDGGVKLRAKLMTVGVTYDATLAGLPVAFVKNADDTVSLYEYIPVRKYRLRFENQWEDCLYNWKQKFNVELSFFRRERGNYLNIGPELWLGSVTLFGLAFSRSEVLVNDTHHVSLTLFGFGIGLCWETEFDETKSAFDDDEEEKENTPDLQREHIATVRTE